MSLYINGSGTRIKKGGIAAVGVSGLILLASAVAPASGAYFADAKDGQATITTPTFKLGLSDGNNNGTFNLAFSDLLPGDDHSESFTVTNTGSIAGTVRLFSNPSGLTDDQAQNLSDLKFQVESYGDIALTSGYNAPINLGILQAGESKTYTVTAGLDRYAGDVWQGAAITDTLEVMLSQR